MSEVRQLLLEGTSSSRIKSKVVLLLFFSLSDYDVIDRHSPSLYEPEQPLTKTNINHPKTQEIVKLKRTQAWLEDDVEIVPYPDHEEVDIEIVSYPDHEDFESNTLDTDCSPSKDKKPLKKYKPKKSEFKCVLCKKSHSKHKRRSCKNEIKKDSKQRISMTGLFKKVSLKNSSYSTLVRSSSSKYIHIDRNDRIMKKNKNKNNRTMKIAKPVKSY